MSPRVPMLCLALISVAVAIAPEPAHAQRTEPPPSEAPAQSYAHLEAAIAAVTLAEAAKAFPTAARTDSVTPFIVFHLAGLDSATATALEYDLRRLWSPSHDLAAATWRYRVEIDTPSVRGDSAFAWVRFAAATRCGERWQGSDGGQLHIFVRDAGRWHYRGSNARIAGSSARCDATPR